MIPASYIVTGRRKGVAVRFRLVALSTAHALTTARELFPGFTLFTASLDPQWEDAPA